MLIYSFVSDIRKFYAIYAICIQKVKEMSTTTHQVNFRDGSSDLIRIISSNMIYDDIFKILLAEFKKRNSCRVSGYFREKDL